MNLTVQAFLKAYHFQQKLSFQGNLFLRSVFTLVFVFSVNLFSIANMAIYIAKKNDPLPEYYFIGFSIAIFFVFLSALAYYKPRFHQIISKDAGMQIIVNTDFKQTITLIVFSVLINILTSLLVIY